MRPLLVAVSLLLAAGCASPPHDAAGLAAYKANNDPLEPMNRKIFAFNEAIDRAVIRPVAEGYMRLLPGPARDALRNAVSNLGEPARFANNLLQGRGDRARVTLCRFVVNTTIGLVGLADVAKANGLPKQTGDLGQTFYSWGVPSGPYLVLPVVGPSNPRDVAGLGFQTYVDPFRYVTDHNGFPAAATYTPEIVGGIDQRARAIQPLDALRSASIDYYAALRSLFRQNRTAELRGNAPTAVPQAAGLYDDPDLAP
ncbi:MAG TPA: VacJ family lipoprotein [Opitutaceae bacterium]